MADEVGVAPDRRGEVAVVGGGEPRVAERGRVVAGLPHRPEHHPGPGLDAAPLGGARTARRPRSGAPRTGRSPGRREAAARAASARPAPRADRAAPRSRPHPAARARDGAPGGGGRRSARRPAGWRAIMSSSISPWAARCCRGRAVTSPAAIRISISRVSIPSAPRSILCDRRPSATCAARSQRGREPSALSGPSRIACGLGVGERAVAADERAVHRDLAARAEREADREPIAHRRAGCSCRPRARRAASRRRAPAGRPRWRAGRPPRRARSPPGRGRRRRRCAPRCARRRPRARRRDPWRPRGRSSACRGRAGRAAPGPRREPARQRHLRATARPPRPRPPARA